MKITTILLCGSICVAGCISVDSSNRFARDWESPPPEGVDIILLSTPSYTASGKAVGEEKASEAARRLEAEECVPLSRGDAIMLLGKGVAAEGTGEFYLIRGVRFKTSGVFTVFQRGSTTLVVFSAMGSMKVQSVNCPVVVRLPQQPDQVYAMALIDE